RLRRIAPAACSSRLRSAVSMSISWRRRLISASNSCDVGERARRGAHSLRKECEPAASSASVFASWPVAFAKSRTCRGVTTTTRKPARPQAGPHRRSIAACGFDDDHTRAQSLKPRDGGRDARRVIRRCPPATRRPTRHHDVLFRHVYTAAAVTHSSSCYYVWL